MKTKKKIIALIVLVIGIFLLSFGVFKLLNTTNNNHNNDNSNNSQTKNFPLQLTNFQVDNSSKDQVIMILTIKNETRSLKWTLIAFLLPTALGALTCAAINLISRIGM